MDKLELKHLAPYLPYDLKGKATDIDLIDKITFENVRFILSEQPRALPILRPLSDLTKEIEHNSEKFVPVKELQGISKMSIEQEPHYTDKECYFTTKAVHDGYFQYSIFLEMQICLEKIFEWHFDVFGLIEKGLAIDINNG